MKKSTLLIEKKQGNTWRWHQRWSLLWRGSHFRRGSANGPIS